MNAPPLLRPARRLLQGQLASTTRIQNALMPSQARLNSTGNSTAAVAKPRTKKPSVSEPPRKEAEDSPVRLPRSVASLYLQPLRREVTYGAPTCDLQLRSFSVRGLEFFSDFALRAAYVMGLPAFGPVPLPRITERWTVPKSHFIFKKSQENFERVTVRRLIQIRDGHPDTVKIWLAFLQKHAYYGIGMKANMWEFSSLDVGKEMDEQLPEVKQVLDSKWEHLGQSKTLGTVEKVAELLESERFKAAGGR